MAASWSLLDLGADLEIAERARRVDAGVLREAEDPLADDVAHHLVAAAGDATTRRAEQQLRPRVGAPLAGVGGDLRAEQLGGHPRKALGLLRAGQLGDAHLGPGELAGADIVHRPL